MRRLEFSSERLAESEMKSEHGGVSGERVQKRWRVPGLATGCNGTFRGAIVMATTTQKSDTFQCLHHSGEK